MKITKTLVGGVLALSLAATHAQAAATIIRIAGAATYRSPIQKAIEDVLAPSAANGNADYKYGWSGRGRYRPDASIYHGYLSTTGAEVIIETYWTGDLAGVVDLATRKNITKWISVSTYDGLLTGSSTGGYQIPTGYTGDTAPPSASVTVSFASSSASIVSTAGGAGAAAANAIRSTTLVNAGSTATGGAGKAKTIGIAAFQWVLGRLASGYTAPFTNITQQQAYSLTQNALPLSALTGSAADRTKYALLVGRSEDAGARTVPFAEAQLSFSTAPQQFQLTFNNNKTNQSSDNLPTGGTAGTAPNVTYADVSGLLLWPGSYPLNTEPNIFWAASGHSGYNLTSDLTNVLSATNPVAIGSFTNLSGDEPADATELYFVGYNGVADTANLVANGGTALSYNGVPYSVAAVQNGQYSLWSFAHLYYIGGSASDALAGVAKTAVDNIADKVFTVDADINTSGTHNTPAGSGAGIFYNSSILFTRSAEGKPLTPNF